MAGGEGVKGVKAGDPSKAASAVEGAAMCGLKAVEDLTGRLVIEGSLAMESMVPMDLNGDGKVLDEYVFVERHQRRICGRLAKGDHKAMLMRRHAGEELTLVEDRATGSSYFRGRSFSSTMEYEGGTTVMTDISMAPTFQPQTEFKVGAAGKAVRVGDSISLKGQGNGAATIPVLGVTLAIARDESGNLKVDPNGTMLVISTEDGQKVRSVPAERVADVVRNDKIPAQGPSASNAKAGGAINGAAICEVPAVSMSPSFPDHFVLRSSERTLRIVPFDVDGDGRIEDGENVKIVQGDVQMCGEVRDRDYRFDVASVQGGREYGEVSIAGARLAFAGHGWVRSMSYDPADGTTRKAATEVHPLFPLSPEIGFKVKAIGKEVFQGDVVNVKGLAKRPWIVLGFNVLRYDHSSGAVRRGDPEVVLRRADEDRRYVSLDDITAIVHSAGSRKKPSPAVAKGGK